MAIFWTGYFLLHSIVFKIRKETSTTIITEPCTWQDGRIGGKNQWPKVNNNNNTWRSPSSLMCYFSSNFLTYIYGVTLPHTFWDRIDIEWLNLNLFPWFEMFPDQGSCSWWRNQLHRGENSGSRFIFPHFQKNNAWFTNNGTLNSPTFKTNNIELTNFSMNQHQTRQLVNGTTLILPTFQWNNADLANQPLSILSFSRRRGTAGLASSQTQGNAAPWVGHPVVSC